MLLLLSDENFNNDIVRGLIRRFPKLDLVRVQDVGLREKTDSEILQWASEQNRVLLTHDISTLPPLAYERIQLGFLLPGVFLIPDQMPIGQAIEEILFLSLEVSPLEWKDQIFYSPI